MGDPVIDQVGRIVTGAGPLSERAAAAAAVIREAAAARWVGIYTVSEGMVTCEGWSGPGAPAHPSFPVTKGLTAHAIRARSVALSNDVSGDPRYLTNQDDSGSELIVPVVVDGRAIGTLDVESGSPGAFDGASIARYERLVVALRPLWSQPQPSGTL